MTPDAFVEATDRAFQRARRRVGGVDLDVELADRWVRLSFAGSGFRSTFERALAVRPWRGVDPTARPSLTLHLWDAATTGSLLDGGSWLGRWLGPGGVVTDLSNANVRVSLDLHGTLVSVVDRATRRAFQYAPDARHQATWELTHPASQLWSGWARDNGLVLCHAAAVGEAAAGLLVVGRSGSGKSTTALACRAAGMAWAGDDYVFVEAAAASVVHPLYTSASLEEAHAADHLGRLLPGSAEVLTMANERRKAVLFDAGPSSPTGTSFRLVAVAAARVAGTAGTTFARIRPLEALRALAPSTMTQLGAVDAETLTALTGICRRLPGYRLELGRDVGSIPDAVRALLAQAGEREQVSAGSANA